VIREIDLRSVVVRLAVELATVEEEAEGASGLLRAHTCTAYEERREQGARDENTMRQKCSGSGGE
jgi:hypothetical protein